MFTNTLGQVIVPGDRIVAVAQGYSHAIKIREGVFTGLSPSGNPQYRATYEVWGYWDKNGRQVSWRLNKEDGVKYEKRRVERVSTAHSGRVYKLA